MLDHGDFGPWGDDGHLRLLWIKGDPDKGKTMLLCGIVYHLSPKTRLANRVSMRHYSASSASSKIIKNDIIKNGGGGGLTWYFLTTCLGDTCLPLRRQSIDRRLLYRSLARRPRSSHPCQQRQ